MAGSVAMYCRQQRYPSPRLISYKIPGIRVLWGFGVTLSEVSTLAAQGPDLRHYGFSSNPPRCVPLSPPLLSSLRFRLVNPLSASAYPVGMSPAGRLPPAPLTYSFLKRSAPRMSGPGGIFRQAMT